MNGVAPLLVGAAALYVLMGNKVSKENHVPRGIRNNNPGNLRINKQNAWVGKIPVNKNTDRVFEQFDTPENGIRALLKLLKNYIDGGHNTIEKIIMRFAPPDENNTRLYTEFVANRTGLLPYIPVYHFNIIPIARAIVAMENGQDPYTDSMYKYAWGQV